MELLLEGADTITVSSPKIREDKFGVNRVNFANVRAHVLIVHLKSKAWRVVTFNQIRIF